MAQLLQGDDASDRKGSINLRIGTDIRRLIDRAATALGKSRTEFMVDAARARATDVLLDQRLFTLDSDAFDALARALEAPPAPGPKLRALARQTPVEEQ